MRTFVPPPIAERPRIVCLCGSTSFGEAFAEAALEETLRGHIVLSIGCNLKSDQILFAWMTDDEWAMTKQRLDELHFKKIDLADEVLVLNVGGYIGASTAAEVFYATAAGKPVRYLEPL